MRVNKFLLFPLVLSLTACAGTKATNDNRPSSEYVEISNPAFTMSRDAAATIWVPKSSVDNGPLRGSEVIKKAYDSVTNNQADGTTQQNSTPAPAASPVAVVATSTKPFINGMRNRAAILETGHNQLSIPFKEKLRVLPGSPVISIAPEAAADKLLSRDERAAYAVKAWQDLGVNVSLFVSAPDGLGSGKYLSVEIYDGMGAGLISKVDSIIPTYDAKDSAATNIAVAASMATLADRSREAIAQLPWYAKIVAIEAGNIYINAGHDAGVNLGQKLNILRGGKIVQGLGFAPGTVMGTVVVTGFVGSNGATATIKDGFQAYPTDIIAAQ